MREYWFGDGNVVVPGDTFYHRVGRVMYRPKALTELCKSLSFNPFDEMSQDVIKDSDLLIVEPIRIRDEEIGNTTQRINTLVLGAALNRVLQLGDK